tara:strand:- start:3518 stop:5503 length:1986 start_codon:yes stop_codon:yes gene_type:complete
MDENDIQGDYSVEIIGGIPVLQSVTDSSKTLNNVPNLQQKLKDLYDRFTNQEYESGRFAADSGFDQEAIKRKLNNALGTYMNSAESTGRKVDVKIIPQGKPGGKGKTTEISNNVFGSTSKDTALNAENMTDAIEESTELSKSTDPAERARGQNIFNGLVVIENQHNTNDKHYLASKELLEGDENNPGVQKMYDNINAQILNGKYTGTFSKIVGGTKQYSVDPNKMKMTSKEINSALENKVSTNEQLTFWNETFSKIDDDTGEIVIYKKDPNGQRYRGATKFFNQVEKFEVARLSTEGAQKIQLQQEQEKLSKEALDKKVRYDKQLRIFYHLDPEKQAEATRVNKRAVGYLKAGWGSNFKVKQITTKGVKKAGTADGPAKVYKGDDALSVKDELQYLMNDTNTKFKGMSLNGSYGENEPMATFEVTIPKENGSQENYLIDVELADYKINTPNGGINLDSPSGSIIDLYKEYGGTTGAGVTKRAKQHIDYSAISTPTFTQDYANSEQLTKSGLISKKLKNTLSGAQKFDFDLVDKEVGLIYQESKMSKDGKNYNTKPLTWNALILGDKDSADEAKAADPNLPKNILEQPGTKEWLENKIATLPPAMAGKLVNDICKSAGKTKEQFIHMKEEEVDAKLEALLGNKTYSITAPSHYDLLDLLKQI